MEHHLIEKARKLFSEKITSDTVKMHCTEVESVMKELAIEMKEDEEKWALAGLMHDADCDIEHDVKNQGKKAVEMLREIGFSDEDVLHAILAHNEENTGVNRQSKFDYALSAADNVSGLIYAYALMRKSIKDMDVSGLKKKFKDKRFAATVRRDLIKDIEKTGISLDKFLEISIRAMQKIADKIGFYK